MKRAEFERRYQVIRTVTQGAVQTHHAFASTGNVVMVHEIDPSAAQEATLLAGMIARLEDGERERILDVMEVDGTAMIVTRFLLEHETLRSWLEAAVGSSDELPGEADAAPPTPVSPPTDSIPIPGSPEPDAPPVPASDDGPGEFTRMFQAQGGAPQSPSGGSDSPGDDRGEEFDAVGTGTGTGEKPQDEAPEQDEAGEFTRMFRAVAPPTPPPPETSPPPEPPPAPAEEETPEPAPPPTQAPSPDVSGPGEFTRMFQAVVADLHQGSDADRSPPVREPPPGRRGETAPPPPPTPASPPFTPPTPRGTPEPEMPTEPRGPGEFTRIFGAQGPAPAPPPPSNPSTKGGYTFGQEEEYRSRLGPTPASTPLPPQTRPPESDEARSPNPLDLPRPPGSPPPPGEYTRIIQAADRPTPGSAPGFEGQPGAPPGYPPPPGAAPAHPGGYPPPPSGGYPPSPQPGAAPGPYGAPPAPPPSRGPSRTLLIVGLIVILVLVVALILFFALSGGDPATVPAEGVPEVEG
jgi:hypothetical protein